MERRSFVRSAGLAGVLAAGVAPAVHAQANIRWRLTSAFPKALAAAGIVQTIALRGGAVPWALGLLGAAKLIYEQWQGPLGWMPGSLPPDALPVVTLAHVSGAAGGVLAALMSMLSRRQVSSAGGG